MSGFEDALNKILSSPEDMAKIAEIAKSFGVGGSGSTVEESGESGEPSTQSQSTQSASASPFGAIDPKMLETIGRLMAEYTGKSDKAALLTAISPYLKEEQRGKLARAAEWAKLARIAKIAMKEFNIGGLGGDSGV